LESDDSLSMENNIVVLGLGNLLARDEGFGIHALHQLQAALSGEAATGFDGSLPDLNPTLQFGGESNPADDSPVIQFVDGGVLGLNLLPLVESCTHLLVLDAIDAGSPPGSVLELSGEQLPLYTTQKLSEHQVGFQEILALARFRDHFPAHLQIIGVQPKDLSGGIGLSVQISNSVDEVINRARAVLERWCIDQQN
jgi:hydrogenase maturation protease